MHELRQISPSLRGCATPTLYYFVFFFADARDTSVVSHSSTVTSISGVSSVRIVCSSKLIAELRRPSPIPILGN